MENNEPKAWAVINKKTGELAEMTRSWFGEIIWLVDFDLIPKDVIAGRPYLLFNDTIEFKDYEVLGDL